jgi:hypothetical protein
MFMAARPASGFRPTTSQEWHKLHRAYEELGFAMLVECDIPEENARILAKQTFGGPFGLLVLDSALREVSNA